MIPICFGVIFNLSLATSDCMVISFTCPKTSSMSESAVREVNRAKKLSAHILSDLKQFTFGIHAFISFSDRNRKSLQIVRDLRQRHLAWNISVIIRTKPFKFHLNNEEVTLMIHQDDEFFCLNALRTLFPMLFSFHSDPPSLIGKNDKLT